ncbi:MAG TPA: archease [Thermoflexia bacterium]|nr:MAG: archease [Chloroflexota bacterium]HEY68248.1 archease [Thermoflexia bacterium]
MDKGFEEIEHTADIAIRVWGRDLAELFANAAYGMACQMADPDEVPRTVEQAIELEACDAETLLVTWLNELLYLNERDGDVFVEFEMGQVTPTHVQAVVRGGPPPYQGLQIKAATFSDLKIAPTDEGYETTVVFDV